MFLEILELYRVIVLTGLFLDSTSDELLFFFAVDDEQMCSRVQSATVLAGRLPLKIHPEQLIAEVVRTNVQEVRRTAGHYNEVHNERTVPIIMARCIPHARNGCMTSALKFDVTIVFLDPNFL